MNNIDDVQPVEVQQVEQNKRGYSEKQKACLKKLRDTTLAAMRHYNVDFQTGANALLRRYYDEVMQAGSIFKSFGKWKEEGKKVKKGEKGYLFWTKPLQILTAKDAENVIVNEDEIKIFVFCYLFSDKQVE